MWRMLLLWRGGGSGGCGVEGEGDNWEMVGAGESAEGDWETVCGRDTVCSRLGDYASCTL